jgi:hypothetical protein
MSNTIHYGKFPTYQQEERQIQKENCIYHNMHTQPIIAGTLVDGHIISLSQEVCDVMKPDESNNYR